jgi:hypothetical protein
MSNLAIDRGQQAQFEYRELEAAFNSARLQIMEEIAATEDEDAQKRERLFLEIRSLDKVKTRMRSVIDSGVISAHNQQMIKQGFGS